MIRTNFHPRHGTLLLLTLASCIACTSPLAAEPATVLPDPALDPHETATDETVVFAGGCFWGMQAVFEHVKGVRQAVSGYAGGSKDTAQYEVVSTGTTGHAESERVEFNPQEVTFGQLLKVYFSVAHNPTELNYQGPDEGTQYRSEIFFTSLQQKRTAEAYIAQLGAAKVFGEPIVTRVAALPAFYPAEGYHQDYFILHPESLYIQFNDVPKVQNLKKYFPALYRENPVRVSGL